MSKYFRVFLISWENEFIYRLNFVLWRLRNVLRLLMTYFLWRGIFASNTVVFGYTSSQMQTYVFMVLVVQTLVTSAPSSDNIGGEISSGDLSNYLVKPVGYLKYWFTRDLASKLLNILFSAGEILLLWFVLKPEIVFPVTVLTLIGFFISAILATLTFYLVSSCSRFVAFWMPENSWGLAFLVLVLMEILAGGIFPLDVLPAWTYGLIQLTPFPYLIYFPVAIFSGKIVGWELVRILLQSVVMFLAVLWLNKLIWRKGLMVYQATGR